MRIGKRLPSLLCVAALLLSLGQGVLAVEETTYVLTQADCTVVDNSYGGVTIIKINETIAKAKKDITIPAQLGGKAVTAIGTGEEDKRLFPSSTVLTRVRLPEGLTRIEGYAFKQCSYLEEVILPSTLTSVGHHAFYLLSHLTSVNWNEGLISN